jgi:acetoin utilization protein AcuB
MIVEQVMMSPVFTIEPDASIGQAQELLQNWRCRDLPVNDRGTLVGIISDRDLRVALATADLTGVQPTVGAIMHRDVVTVEPDTPIDDAARLMLRQKVGSLPVLDSEGVVGIVTESDLLALLERMVGLLEPEARIELELRAEAAFGEGALAAYRD